MQGVLKCTRRLMDQPPDRVSAVAREYRAFLRKPPNG